MKVDYPAMYSDTEPMFNCYQVSACDMQCGDNFWANLPLDILQISNTLKTKKQKIFFKYKIRYF